MRWGGLALAVVGLLWSAGVAAAPECPAALSKRIPPRAAAAVSGSGFAAEVAGLSEHEREDVAVARLLAGDIPQFLRTLRPVTLRARLPGKGAVRLTFCVAPDYLAVGSNKDFLRVPLGLNAALAVAVRMGFALPTPELVDAIYAQADLRLAPRPLPASDAMRSTPYLLKHESLIRGQLKALGAPRGTFLAGHKKDLVLTNRLRERPRRVAIYGWHRGEGQPIQPLSTVHGARYADYSHGVRLVSETAFVNGRPMRLSKLLADPELAPLVNGDGPIPELSRLIDRLSADELTLAAAH